MNKPKLALLIIAIELSLMALFVLVCWAVSATKVLEALG